MKTLIVEDDFTSRLALQEMLEKYSEASHGARIFVVTALSGIQNVMASFRGRATLTSPGPSTGPSC